MKKIKNTHPGEILNQEFIIPMKITAYQLAKKIHINPGRISEIIHEKRRVTVDTALRFSKFFGNTPQFWLGLQDDYDLEEKTKKISKELKEIKHFEFV
ncbi:MAG: HigA family addiction module antidote protein [Bacteroidetes bacterium]|nr:HigA family addiction module antidote protein [Bacteroidota bacterium]